MGGWIGWIGRIGWIGWISWIGWIQGSFNRLISSTDSKGFF